MPHSDENSVQVKSSAKESCGNVHDLTSDHEAWKVHPIFFILFQLATLLCMLVWLGHSTVDLAPRTPPGVDPVFVPSHTNTFMKESIESIPCSLEVYYDLLTSAKHAAESIAVPAPTSSRSLSPDSLWRYLLEQPLRSFTPWIGETPPRIGIQVTLVSRRTLGSGATMESLYQETRSALVEVHQRVRQLILELEEEDEGAVGTGAKGVVDSSPLFYYSIDWKSIEIETSEVSAKEKALRAAMVQHIFEELEIHHSKETNRKPFMLFQSPVVSSDDSEGATASTKAPTVVPMSSLSVLWHLYVVSDFPAPASSESSSCFAGSPFPDASPLSLSSFLIPKPQPHVLARMLCFLEKDSPSASKAVATAFSHWMHASPAGSSPSSQKELLREDRLRWIDAAQAVSARYLRESLAHLHAANKEHPTVVRELFSHFQLQAEREDADGDEEEVAGMLFPDGKHTSWVAKGRMKRERRRQERARALKAAHGSPSLLDEWSLKIDEWVEYWVDVAHDYFSGDLMQREVLRVYSRGQDSDSLLHRKREGWMMRQVKRLHTWLPDAATAVTTTASPLPRPASWFTVARLSERHADRLERILEEVLWWTQMGNEAAGKALGSGPVWLVPPKPFSDAECLTLMALRVVVIISFLTALLFSFTFSIKQAKNRRRAKKARLAAAKEAALKKI